MLGDAQGHDVRPLRHVDDQTNDLLEVHRAVAHGRGDGGIGSGLGEAKRSEQRRIEDVQVQMNGKVIDARSFNSVRDHRAVFRELDRSDMTDAVAFDEGRLLLHEASKPRQHHMFRLERHPDLGGELVVTLPKKASEDHGVSVGTLVRCRDVGMRVDPQHSEFSAVSLVEVGERSQLNQAVPTEDDDPIRCVNVDKVTCRAKLAQQCLPAVNPVFVPQGNVTLGFDRNLDQRLRAVRSQPGEEPGAKGVGGIVPALPLEHQHADRPGRRFVDDLLPCSRSPMLVAVVEKATDKNGY